MLDRVIVHVTARHHRYYNIYDVSQLKKAHMHFLQSVKIEHSHSDFN